MLRRLVAVGVVAWLGSVVIASASKVGERCGGIAGPVCDAGLWCEPPAGMCYVSDIPGACVKAGEMCMQIYEPVCGCDGRTYGNDCERRSKKVQLNHRGKC